MASIAAGPDPILFIICDISALEGSHVGRDTGHQGRGLKGKKNDAVATTRAALADGVDPRAIMKDGLISARGGRLYGGGPGCRRDLDVQRPGRAALVLRPPSVALQRQPQRVVECGGLVRQLAAPVLRRAIGLAMQPLRNRIARQRWPSMAVRALPVHAAVRHRAIQAAVWCSCNEFCASRCASAGKSTWSSGWSWLKHENT